MFILQIRERITFPRSVVLVARRVTMSVCFRGCFATLCATTATPFSAFTKPISGWCPDCCSNTCTVRTLIPVIFEITTHAIQFILGTSGMPSLGILIKPPVRNFSSLCSAATGISIMQCTGPICRAASHASVSFTLLSHRLPRCLLSPKMIILFSRPNYYTKIRVFFHGEEKASFVSPRTV